MSLTNTNRAICNKMSKDFEGIISPVMAAKNKIKGVKREFEDGLNGISFSPDGGDILSEQQRLMDELKANLPGNQLEDMQDLKDLIASCLYLEDFSPVGALMGTINSVFDKMRNFLGNSHVPEFGLGNIGDRLNKLLSGLNFPGGLGIGDLLKKADKLIECLAGVCGSGDPQYIASASEYATTVNDLYDEMGIISDPNAPNYGKFDYETVYNNAGVSPTNQLNMDTAMSGISDMNDECVSAISSSVNAAKSLMKGGFF